MGGLELPPPSPLATLLDTAESDIIVSCSEYEPEDSDSDHSQLSSDNEEENQTRILANEDNDVQ